MAIEPLNSAMTYQAAPAAPAAPAAKPAQQAEDMEVNLQQKQPAVDEQTSVVQAAAEKEDAKNQSGGQEQNRNSQIKRAVEQINKRMQNSEALFGIHEKTNRVTIKIVDKETKEVIKELPPEKTLDMIAKAWEMAGLLVDEKR